MANKKKDFAAVDTGRVYSAIEESLAEPEQEPQEAQQPQGAAEAQAQAPARQLVPGTRYTAEEIREFQEAGRTTGRAGVKMLRVNMAFTPAVHDYIRTMAQVRGQTITQFTNHVFEKSMQENAELYSMAQEFLKRL